MKTKYFIIALFTVTLTMVSCSESFLDQPPYGSVITQEQYEKLDKQYVLKVKKEQSYYRCLTAQKAYYMENYPEIIVENGSIDELMVVMIRGEEV